jgi:hypothetical protein
MALVNKFKTKFFEEIKAFISKSIGPENTFVYPQLANDEEKIAKILTKLESLKFSNVNLVLPKGSGRHYKIEPSAIPKIAHANVRFRAGKNGMKKYEVWIMKTNEADLKGGAESVVEFDFIIAGDAPKTVPPHPVPVPVTPVHPVPPHPAPPHPVPVAPPHPAPVPVAPPHPVPHVTPHPAPLHQVDPNLCNFKVGEEIHVIGTENSGKEGKVSGVVNCVGHKNESANKYNIHLGDGKDVKDVIEFSLRHGKKGIEPCSIPKGYICKLEGDKYICTKMAGGSYAELEAKYMKYKMKYLSLKNSLK